MKLIEKHKQVQNLNLDEVPYKCLRVFGDKVKNYSVMGEEICLGEDYVSIEEAREALSWYVDQLGGKVKWDK